MLLLSVGIRVIVFGLSLILIRTTGAASDMCTLLTLSTAYATAFVSAATVISDGIEWMLGGISNDTE